MFMEERHEKIAQAIRQNGKITVAEITAEYGISDESARRDLRILEQKGICKRTHGGAIILSQVSVRPPVDRKFEEMTVNDNYREIAKRGASLIKKNDIVFLSGGTFGYIMTSFLPRDFYYTVVVNTVDMGKAMRDFDNVDVYIAGGKMRKSGSVVDTMAADFVSRMHFDICFITGAGITSDFGVSNGTDETANFQRTVIRNSRHKVLLIPGAKIGIDSFIKVCDADVFDTVITDWDGVDDEINALRDKDVEVICVEEPK